jgi:integrase
VGCVAALRQLSCEDVERFFVTDSQDHGMSARRSMRSAMRLFLRFAAARGWVDDALGDSVPSLRSYRLSGLPRGLSEEQLSKVLGEPWRGQCPRRDRAIVYLLATYGVRRGQISALRLEDIDWHEKTIDFAPHKGGKAVCHALTPAVAEALVDYLFHERPASSSDHVFLRHRRPYGRLNPSAITALVSSRARRCGLPTAIHPHAFRHAFASRLLRAGQPIKAIADLLGHRSLAAVAVYAKVDHARLLECAVDWPETGR